MYYVLESLQSLLPDIDNQAVGLIIMRFGPLPKLSVMTLACIQGSGSIVGRNQSYIESELYTYRNFLYL
jgi:hypothetical protein